jgi:hypothetical protein
MNFSTTGIEMHYIEPYFSWRHLYDAAEDERSPFYNRQYSEFEFTHAVYDHCIHPQWDEIGSATLYMKLLYAGYDSGFAIVELMGEWNDCLYNDIMFLKRNIVEPLIAEGINKFILVGENVLNFHSSEDDYYQEWFEDVEDGWIVAINFRDHVLQEFAAANIDYYLAFGGQFNTIDWRTLTPVQLYERINHLIAKRLSA